MGNVIHLGSTKAIEEAEKLLAAERDPVMAFCWAYAACARGLPSIQEVRERFSDLPEQDLVSYHTAFIKEAGVKFRLIFSAGWQEQTNVAKNLESLKNFKEMMSVTNGIISMQKKESHYREAALKNEIDELNDEIKKLRNEILSYENEAIRAQAEIRKLQMQIQEK